MPVNTGASFASKLGSQLPGMANALGQKYGGNLSGAARSASSLLGSQKAPMFGGGARRAKQPNMSHEVTTGMGNQPLPGTSMPMPSPIPMRAQAPGLQMSPEMGGEIQAQMPQSINTAPSPQLFQNPYANIFGGSSGYGSSGNTGIAGGLFNRPPGYERPNMGAPGTDIGGMFGRFNQMSQNPGRRY